LFLSGGVDGYGPWHEHVESWLASPLREEGSLLVLKYEDLLQDPVVNVSKAMDFLGATVERERAEEAVDRYSADRMRQQERQSRFHEKQKRHDILFVRTAESGDWGRTFSPEDEELFARVTGDLPRRLGYGDRRGAGDGSGRS
jgi:hypothetical protein